MKTNRFLIAILSVALCVNFVSCGDDDDNNIIDPENVTKRVAACTKKHPYYVIDYAINYDNDGKVSKIVCQNDWTYDYYDFSFSGNEAVATSEMKYGSYTIKFSLNGNGYCTSAIWTGIEKDSTTTYVSTNNYKFTYNSDNQVIKADFDGDIEEYVYKDGVMISSSLAEIITYTDIPNIGNLFVAFSTDNNDPIEEWRLAGLLGKASKFLPRTTKWHEGMETYNYELDEEGYVKTVKVTFRDTKGSESSYSYKYTYKNIK